MNALTEPQRCNMCGRPVAGFFDHVDVDCMSWPEDAEVIASIKEALSNALDNGHDLSVHPAEYVAGDLIECDATFEGWNVEALTPLVVEAMKPEVSLDPREAAIDKLCAKGFAVRLPDGEYALTDLGRDAADDMKLQRKDR